MHGRWDHRTSALDEPEPKLRQNVAVLFSQSTRQMYIDEAKVNGAIYPFVDAWDQKREWVKGQYAYLAPNAAISLLHRYNIKHDVISEYELSDQTLAQYRAIVIPNGGHLEGSSMTLLQNWLRRDGADGQLLIVTGRTNLPPETLGLASYEFVHPDGYTAWSFTDKTRFGDASTWEEFYLSGYRGHTVAKAEAAEGATVVAELWEMSGDTSSAERATRTHIGDAIVATDRTLYVANQVLEYMGGAFQGHYNVEDARRWYHPTHYLDTLGYLLRELLIKSSMADLFATQLRTFGDYEGAVVFRHDTDTKPGETLDLSMLDWQIENVIPATYVILDPDVSTGSTTHTASQSWIDRGRTASYIELGLHNDGQIGSPPTYVQGRAMTEHFQNADRTLGITSRTGGRHFGFHMHPETLDAMEHLYEQLPDLIGLCTFSVLQVIEYGVLDPGVIRLGQPITYSTAYATEEWTCGAVPGWWFPFHVAITSTDRYHVLRGWDSTKESECDFDRIDALLDGQNSKDPRVRSQLPNGVFTVQYHPQDAQSTKKNNGRGSLEWVRYLATVAERKRFWLATKQMVYERLNDYQNVQFRLESDGSMILHNPTSRTISGLMVRTEAPVSTLLIEGSSVRCIHNSPQNMVTLPPLEPDSTLRLVHSDAPSGIPILRMSNTKTFTVVSALHFGQTRGTCLMLEVTGRNNLELTNLTPGSRYLITMIGANRRVWEQVASDEGAIEFKVYGAEKMTTPTTVEVTNAPA